MYKNSAMSIRKPFRAAGARLKKPFDTTRFFNAARHGHIGTLKEFLEKYDDAVDWTHAGRTALFIAIERGNYMAVDVLLRHGAEPDDRVAIADMRPLHAAAKIDRADIAGLLLHRLAHVDGTRTGNITPLMDAVRNDGTKTAKVLLRFGASTEKMNDDGDAVLHIAAATNHPACVLLLLDSGARIDAPNKNGQTPLMIAAAHGGLDAARLLLARGADQHLVNHEGESALDIALRNADPEFAEGFKNLIDARNRKDALTMGIPFTEGTERQVSVSKPLKLRRGKARRPRP